MDILSTAAKKTIQSRLQAWITRALLVVVMIAGGFGVASYVMLERQKATTAVLAQRANNALTRVSVVEEANRTQGEAIKAIQTATALSDTLLKGLQQQFESIRSNDKNVRDRLTAVEKTNEAARAYLNAAVPGAVGCVLDQTCVTDKDSVSQAKRGLDDAVQSATDKTQQNKP